MAEKQPIVVEMSTNLQSGVTTCLGVSGVQCQRCGSQKTVAREGVTVCLDSMCKTEVKA